MYSHIEKSIDKVAASLKNLSGEEIGKAINLIHSVYERDGRIYIFGNGGSLALATHWGSDFNKTVFSHHLDKSVRRFQAIRLPTTEEELTAWANDIGYDMVFLGPLQNYLQDNDIIIAISSSGNSLNVIKAVRFAKKHKVQIIGLSGFDGGALNKLADAKIHIQTEKGEYSVVESVHATILHLMTQYFKDYFDHLLKRK